MDQERVVRRSGAQWDGVPVEGYRPGAAVGVERHTIVGGRKNGPDEPGPKLEMRYFRLAPGAVSRLEKHEHEHYVIVGEGEGYVVHGESAYEVGAHDVVYVGPLESHQFLNRGTTPFGFFCVVPAHRDPSQQLSAEELARLAASPAGAIAQPDGAPRPRYEREPDTADV